MAALPVVTYETATYLPSFFISMVLSSNAEPSLKTTVRVAEVAVSVTVTLPSSLILYSQPVAVLSLLSFGRNES